MSDRLDETERFYRDALAIDRRLADIDESNVTAQQALHVSFQRLGDLVTSIGRMAEARQVYADHLAWLERRLEPDDPTLQSARAKLQGLDRSDE